MRTTTRNSLMVAAVLAGLHAGAEAGHISSGYTSRADTGLRGHAAHQTDWRCTANRLAKRRAKNKAARKARKQNR